MIAETVWLFMHIPKTAGTSLKQILTREYKEFGGLETVYEPDEVAFGPKRKDAKIYLGHFRYGFHQHLEGNPRYISFIRRPEDQAWSHFHYLQSLNRLPSEIKDFKDFLHHPYGNNLQLRFISGIENIAGKEWDVLEIAKQNIKRDFAFVATVEEYNKALLLLKRRLGWHRLPLYHIANVQHEKPLMTSEDYNFANTQLQPEIELYHFVNDWFVKEYLKDNHGDLDLEIFKLENKAFRNLDPLYVQLKTLFRFNSKNS